jgi:hypothetical protein
LGEGERVLPHNVRVQSSTTAYGALSGAKFAGQFSIAYRYSGLPNVTDDVTLHVHGRFEMHLG